MGHIKRGDLSNSIVLVPAGEELSKMDDMITPLLEKVIYNSNQIHTLGSLRDALLPELMSGATRA